MLILSFFIMSSKNKWKTALFVVSTVLFYGIIYTNNSLRKANKANELIYNELQRNYTSNSDLLCNNKKIVEVMNSYRRFRASLPSDSLHLPSGKPLLIYRYSQFVCNACVFDDLKELEALLDDVGKERILILSAFPDNRENRLMLHNRLSKFNHINIPMDSFDIPSNCYDDYHTKFFAVLDPMGNIETVFFPQSGNLKLIRLFFDEIKERLKQH